MVRWNETFWGDGNRGFDVLSTNVKNGAIAIDEFQRFLNESSQCEITYCKNLSRLQSQLLKVQHVGTFTPVWHSIRDLLEKISVAHSATVTYYQELLRDVHFYQESYQKKVKTQIQKDPDITRTADLITQLNNTLNTVNKSKEQYHTIGVDLDYERSKRAGSSLANGSSTPIPQDNNASSSLAQTAFSTLTSSTRQIERLEKKYRQTHDDYKTSVEKYNSLRNEFEKRFYDACTKFQEFEIEHVDKMLSFSKNYSEILKRNNEQVRLAQNDFIEKIGQFTNNDLLTSFVEQKKTGNERPTPLQFEENDTMKSSMHLINSSNLPLSMGHESMVGPSDELIIFDQPETNLPSFLPHFPVSSPTISSGWPSTTNVKYGDNSRGLASSASISNSNLTMLPQFNNPPMSLSNPNNPLSRLQETSNDQTSNPFDVRIKRTPFKGFWPTARKDKKDKKQSSNSKKTKATPVQQQYDETGSVNSQNSANDTNDYNKMTGSRDDLNQISTLTKNKCPTPEPYTLSNPTIPSSEITRPTCQSTIPFPISAMRKSTSSSDSSDDDDDDDDFPISKINFTIRPTTVKSPITEESDAAKISSAMRLIDKNIGHVATCSRTNGRKMADMSKSISSGHIGTRIPPPLPSRPTTTLSTSITTETLGRQSSIPIRDENVDMRSKSISVSTNQQDNVTSVPLYPRSSTISTEAKISTPISSTDDDTEITNSFFIENNLSQKQSSRTMRARHSLQQQQPTLSLSGPTITNGRMTPFIGPSSQSFPNGLTTSIDQRTSPLTIGATDQIPIAIAFQETIHVMMTGDEQSKWKIRILGDMLVSFPAAILNLIVDPSPHLNTLEFRLKNLDKIENVIANPQLITLHQPSSDSDGPTYSFNMPALSQILRNLQDKNRSLPFFNFGILKYEVKHTGVSNIPIQVSSQWTRTLDTITILINYRFNSLALPESVRLVNDIVTFHTVIPDGLQIHQSLPMAEWSLNEKKLSWKVPYIFDGSGTLSASVMTIQSTSDDDANEQQHKPLTTSSTIHVQFLAENALFSTIDFEFACRGYRVSLLKKKICSGKYQSEIDQTGPLQFFRRSSVEQNRMNISTPIVA